MAVIDGAKASNGTSRYNAPDPETERGKLMPGTTCGTGCHRGPTYVGAALALAALACVTALPSPTPFETKVVLFSDRENAVVGTPVTSQITHGAATIKKGDTKGTFTVQTNDNKLQPGGHVTAYITAFYAEPFDPVPLRIESPRTG
jgi:hypothetical protein